MHLHAQHRPPERDSEEQHAALGRERLERRSASERAVTDARPPIAPAAQHFAAAPAIDPAVQLFAAAVNTGVHAIAAPLAPAQRGTELSALGCPGMATRR